MLVDCGFDWNRYWLEHNDNERLLRREVAVPRGYLRFDDDSINRLMPGHRYTFEELSRVPYILFVSPPGMGKTCELQKYCDQINDTSSDVARYHDLTSYPDASYLHQRVFQSDAFRQWKRGDHILHLFLDSLDVSRNQINPIASVLADSLGGLQLERLRLRVACRTFDLPLAMEHLNELWRRRYAQLRQQSNDRIKEISAEYEHHDLDQSDDAFFTESRDEPPLDIEELLQSGWSFAEAMERVTEVLAVESLPEKIRGQLETLWIRDYSRIVKLEQLRPSHIREAIRHSPEVNVSKFEAEVERQDVVQFATQPLILLMLIREFLDQGSLPPDKWQIFHKTCLKLCEEPRPELDDMGKLRTRKRLEIAAWLAATTIFSNHPGLSRHNSEDGRAHPNLLSIDELLELQYPHALFTEEQIKEVLGTALFDGRDNIIFAHKSLEEFLAAYYLKIQDVSAKQILELVPDLAENVWLAEN